jgi:hypothetical protein
VPSAAPKPAGKNNVDYFFPLAQFGRLDWFGDVHVKACLKGTQTVFASCEKRQGYRRDRIYACRRARHPKHVAAGHHRIPKVKGITVVAPFDVNMWW